MFAIYITLSLVSEFGTIVSPFLLTSNSRILFGFSWFRRFFKFFWAESILSKHAERGGTKHGSLYPQEVVRCVFCSSVHYSCINCWMVFLVYNMPDCLCFSRCSSATNRLITSKDHASVQINVGHLDETGRYTGQFSTFALCGFIRAQVRRALFNSMSFALNYNSRTSCFSGCVFQFACFICDFIQQVLLLVLDEDFVHY